MRSAQVTRLAGIIALAGGMMLPALHAESVRPGPGDWPTYDHDPDATRYSPLEQINTSNVSKLTRAWTFTTRVPTPPGAGQQKGRGGGRGFAFPTGIGNEVTPIVVNGVMYAPAGIW